MNDDSRERFDVRRSLFNVRCSLLVLFLTLATCHTSLAQTNGTPFYCQLFNADGSPQTNIVTMQVWPPDDNAFTVDGTNIIFGNTIYSNTPNPSGFFTNRLFANTYVVKIPSSGRSFFVKLLDTPNYLPLAYYVTNVANVSAAFTMYGLVTNWLGYAPIQPTFSGVTTALGYTPLTNTFAAVTNVMHYTPLTNTFNAITNILAYVPATNSWAGIIAAFGNVPATNTYSMLVASLGYTPLTNTFAALTNAISYVPATNSYPGAIAALGYQPATNSWMSITNLLIGNGGVTALQGYQSATNSSFGIFAAMGFVAANITNTPGMFTGRDFAIITNGLPGVNTPLLIYTNMATAVVPNFVAPNGSILVSSNGLDYIRTNGVWKGILTQ